jgi:esterase/lipase superfamily enzyme
MIRPLAYLGSFGVGSSVSVTLTQVQEPYRTEFERDRIEVFDLTSLKSADNNAHGRAFDEAPTVATMVRERLIEGQTMADREPDIDDRVEQAVLSSK